MVMSSRHLPASAAPLGHGRTAEVYPWGENQVLKLFLSARMGTAAQHEARVTQAAHAAGLAAPAVEDMIEIDGRPGIILERGNGPSMLSELAAHPWRLARLASTLAELHVAMHGCDLPALPSLQARLQRHIESVDVLPAATKKRVLSLLSRLPEGHALCHGDFHPDNVLLSQRGPMILDWANAVQGYPLGDVARTSLVLRFGGSPPDALLPRLLRLIRPLFNSVYLRRYAELRPAPRSMLAAWLVPVAAARLEENVPGEQPHLLSIVESGLRKYT